MEQSAKNLEEKTTEEINNQNVQSYDQLSHDELWNFLEKKDKILKFENVNREELSESERKKFDEYEGKIENISPIEEGQVIKGIIHQISRKEVLIDVNYKDYIYIENNSSDWKYVKNLNVGDEIDVLITEIQEHPQFKIKGSISELIRKDVENNIKQYFDEQIPIDARVIDRNSAGFVLKLDIKGVEFDAFMPNTIAAPNKMTQQQSDELMGKHIKVCLETLKEDQGMFVVSRKSYLNKYVLPEEIKKIKLNETVYKGIVTGTTPFGVFVEFKISEENPRCLTGMIHKVNLNPKYNIENIKPGMNVEFYVKDIVKNGKQIILTQVLRETLWDKIENGLVLEGTVKSHKIFGVLVELDKETYGVISNNKLNKLNKKLSNEEKVNVKIISFNKDERKIYLDVVNDNDKIVNNE